MSNVTVRPEQFEQAVMKALGEYGEEVYKTTDRIAKSTAREASSALKTENAGGKFAKGWSHRAQDTVGQGINQVVYNREYQLIHLMEYPHDTGGGGYYPKNVDYTGVIKKNEEEYSQKFMDEVVNAL